MEHSREEYRESKLISWQELVGHYRNQTDYP